MTKRIRKLLAVVCLLLAIGAMTGCGKGNNNETQATTEESTAAWTVEPTTIEPTTAEPTTEAVTTIAETTAEPSTEFPKMETPEYYFAMIDHAKVGDRYYSTYYLQFDKPGYYISDHTGKSKYYDKDGGANYSHPSKVFQWIERPGDDQVFYKVALVFISKEEEKVPAEGLTFEVPVRYRYDSENSAYIETMKFTVNTPIADIKIDNMADNAPILLDGHYLGLDPEVTGIAYGNPDGDKTREYCMMEFFYVRLSYEDIDETSLKNHLAIARYDQETKSFKPYTPPEGYENIISFRQSTDNGLRYLRIGIGMSYPKDIAGQTQFDIEKELVENMILVYVDDGKVVYYAYYE